VSHIYGTATRIIVSTQIHTGKGYLYSLLIGVDTINNPVVAVYDDVGGATAANQIVPSTTYDATALGLNGVVLKFAKEFVTGLYISIATIGSGSVVADWRSQGQLFPEKMR
jgi:hypothetical protein